jgi:hypothetical protein
MACITPGYSCQPQAVDCLLFAKVFGLEVARDLNFGRGKLTFLRVAAAHLELIESTLGSTSEAGRRPTGWSTMHELNDMGTG